MNIDFDKIIYYSAVPIFVALFIFLLVVFIKNLKNNKK